MHLTGIARSGMIVIKRMDVPLYSSKYSRKDYTIHQHLMSFCVKELEEHSYRDHTDLLEEFSELREALKLDKVPHYTTLNKFLKRFPPRWFKFLLKRLVELMGSKHRVTVDGTGIKLTTASYSYIKRIGKKIKKRDCFKVILAIDSDDGTILAFRGVHGNRHESPFFIPLLEDIPGKLIDVCADKGLDSKKNHKYIQKDRKAHSFLDVRKEPKRGRYRKSVYRRKKKYPKRWKKAYRRRRNRIESKNYSFKHRFGDYIPGKNIHFRRKYLGIRIFALNLYNSQNHNLSIFSIFMIVEVFYSPPLSAS